MRFENQVAIVTGGASGIGLATALRLGREGARVVIADHNFEQGQIAAEQTKASGAPDAWASACDVSVEEQVAATVAETLVRFGRFDVLVNNAGLMIFKCLSDLTGADWQKILGVDLLGAFYFTKQALLHMQKGGAIVNVSSIHAVETEPQVAPYAAAKAALLSLTRSTALESRGKGIRVNAILPGAIATSMLWDNPHVRSGKEKVERSNIGQPEDVAAVIAFLASDDAKFIQGASLRVDGGRLDRL